MNVQFSPETLFNQESWIHLQFPEMQRTDETHFVSNLIIREANVCQINSVAQLG